MVIHDVITNQEEMADAHLFDGMRDIVLDGLGIEDTMAELGIYIQDIDKVAQS